VKCCDITAGMLNERIVFQVRTETPDSYGDVTTTFADSINAWAYIRPVSDHTAFMAATFRAEITHKIIVRYRSDITAAMRIKFGSRYFIINGLRNLEEQKRWLEISALESVEASK